MPHHAPRRRRTVPAALCVLGLVILGSAPSEARKRSSLAPDDSECVTFEIAAGHRPELRVVNGQGTWTLRKRGRHVSATLDGRAVDAAQVIREGSTVRVLGPGGEVRIMFGLLPDPGPDGQLIYAPYLDPTSAHARFGLKVEPLDEEIGKHLGLSAGEALRVRGVCPDSPAERAGIRADDLLLRLDGSAPATRDRLNRLAGSLAPNGTLAVAGLRSGQPLEVSLIAGSVGDWPAPEPFEDSFRAMLRP